MATSEEFKNEVAKLFPNNLKFRKMMGEYVMYFNDVVIGGLYDDRLLLKPSKNLGDKYPNLLLEFPYSGAKPMVRVMITKDADKIIEEAYKGIIN